MKGSVLSQSLNFIFKLNDFLIINLYLNKQFGSYDSVSSSCAPSCSGRKKKYFKLNQLLLELFSSFPQQKLETFLISHIFAQTCIKPKKYMTLTHLDIIVFLFTFRQSRVIDVSA